MNAVGTQKRDAKTGDKKLSQKELKTLAGSLSAKEREIQEAFKILDAAQNKFNQQKEDARKAIDFEKMRINDVIKSNNTEARISSLNASVAVLKEIHGDNVEISTEMVIDVANEFFDYICTPALKNIAVDESKLSTEI